MDSPVPTPIAFDDVVIDLAGHRVLLAGVEQPLEPKAFGVLALLVQAPGRVFTRNQILDAVWAHHHVTPGVLNRVMSLLRHALGEDAQSPRYLHTVHGIGYRFDLASATSPPRFVPEKAAAKPAPVVVDVIAVEPVPQPIPLRRSGDLVPLSGRRLAMPWFLTMLAVMAIAGWSLWPTPSPPSAASAIAPLVPPETRSIAVLPLANTSGDAEQQFFSDGLSENLIDALSRFEGLKVIGRTSSFRFRESRDDSKAIGTALGVTYLVSGSVQHAGGAVRVGVELVTTADGRTIWTDHYDRPYQDMFALQDEITRAIAGALQAKLLQPGLVAKQDNRPPSGNIEAYNVYLRGMQSFHAGKLHDMATYQSTATRLDPAYSSAWAQLSIAWALIGYDSNGNEAQTAFARARAAADRALSLAPELGIAHGALGNLLLGADFNWQGAIAELRRGTQLVPENGQNHGGLSRALAASGRLHEALEERERFLRIDPLQPFNYSLYANLLLATGRLDEAERTLRVGETLQPEAPASPQLMYVAILRGDREAALKEARRRSPPQRRLALALAEQMNPDRGTADAALAAVLTGDTWTKSSPYAIAQIYALRGDSTNALKWLQRTWQQRDTHIHYLLYDPLILRFRDDPLFIAFCRQIGLPDPQTSEALSIDQIRAATAAKR